MENLISFFFFSYFTADRKQQILFLNLNKYLLKHYQIEILFKLQEISALGCLCKWNNKILFSENKKKLINHVGRINTKTVGSYI